MPTLLVYVCVCVCVLPLPVPHAPALSLFFSVVISLYNYNFCGYETRRNEELGPGIFLISTLARRGNHRSTTAPRPLIANIIGFYSETRFPYLMHRRPASSPGTDTYMELRRRCSRATTLRHSTGHFRGLIGAFQLPLRKPTSHSSSARPREE